MTRRARWRVRRLPSGRWCASSFLTVAPGLHEATFTPFPTWADAIAHALTNGHHQEPTC